PDAVEAALPHREIIDPRRRRPAALRGNEARVVGPAPEAGVGFEARAVGHVNRMIGNDVDRRALAVVDPRGTRRLHIDLLLVVGGRRSGFYPHHAFFLVIPLEPEHGRETLGKRCPLRAFGWRRIARNPGVRWRKARRERSEHEGSLRNGNGSPALKHVRLGRTVEALRPFHGNTYREGGQPNQERPQSGTTKSDD